MQPQLEPTFLDGFQGGRRFALWVGPPAGVPARGCVLCIQPFGEEANLSRRVLVAQACRLAGTGWTTLIVDLFGTGDSDGATADASLPLWRADLLRASRIARERVAGPFVLWGTRMGALLAAELAIALDQLAAAMLFWQPAASGAQFIDPLLKLARVGAVARQAGTGHASDPAQAGIAAGGSGTAIGPGSASDALPAGSGNGLLDLAGHRLRRDLVDDLAAMSMQPPVHGEHGAPCPVLMLGIQRVLAVAAPAPKPLSALAERWLTEGYLSSLRVVQGEPFWASLEPSLPLAAFEATERFLESIDAQS